MRGARVWFSFFILFLLTIIPSTVMQAWFHFLIFLLTMTIHSLDCDADDFQVCLSDVKTETGLRTLEEFEEAYGSHNVHFIKYVNLKRLVCSLRFLII